MTSGPSCPLLRRDWAARKPASDAPTTTICRRTLSDLIRAARPHRGPRVRATAPASPPAAGPATSARHLRPPGYHRATPGRATMAG